MKKVLHILAKILLSAILIMPILGTLGIFPAPTADMYNSPEAFQFIEILMTAKYINIIMALVFATSFILIWANRTALAALLLLPITVNIVGFHAFLDGGLLMPGAIMGNVLLLLNLYFLWHGRKQYTSLIKV